MNGALRPSYCNVVIETKGISKPEENFVCMRLDRAILIKFCSVELHDWQSISSRTNKSRTYVSWMYLGVVGNEVWIIAPGTRMQVKFNLLLTGTVLARPTAPSPKTTTNK
jgi:hypothetical protein